jgi:hypothetical protein
VLRTFYVIGPPKGPSSPRSRRRPFSPIIQRLCSPPSCLPTSPTRLLQHLQPSSTSRSSTASLVPPSSSADTHRLPPASAGCLQRCQQPVLSSSSSSSHQILGQDARSPLHGRTALLFTKVIWSKVKNFFVILFGCSIIYLYSAVSTQHLLICSHSMFLIKSSRHGICFVNSNQLMSMNISYLVVLCQV